MKDKEVINVRRYNKYLYMYSRTYLRLLKFINIKSYDQYIDETATRIIRILKELKLVDKVSRGKYCLFKKVFTLLRKHLLPLLYTLYDNLCQDNTFDQHLYLGNILL